MTSFRLLSPHDFRRVPWRNGGGTTAEIVTWPADAGGDAFAGRVSIANLDRDSVFSAWPGIDRTFVLLDGDGVVLVHDGAEVTLTALHDPYRFSGDRPSSCRLVGGSARAFNLMVRRGEARGEVVVAGARAPSRGHGVHASATRCAERASACSRAGRRCPRRRVRLRRRRSRSRGGIARESARARRRGDRRVARVCSVKVT